MSYTRQRRQGHFDPEYAEVYGVPFAFIPCAGAAEDGPKRRARSPAARPRASRAAGACPWLEITFPRLAGYRYEMPPSAARGRVHRRVAALVLSTADMPTRTENAPIVGEIGRSTRSTTSKHRREQEVAFAARPAACCEHYFPADEPDGGPAACRSGCSRRCSTIASAGCAECVELQGRRRSRSCCSARRSCPRRRGEDPPRHRRASRGRGRASAPSSQPYDPSAPRPTSSFDTTKRPLDRRPDEVPRQLRRRCDSDWERSSPRRSKSMDEVKAYVKNQNLGFKIPYTHEGQPGRYYPDYLVRVDDGHGPDDLLNLIVEISGRERSRTRRRRSTPRETCGCRR